MRSDTERCRRIAASGSYRWGWVVQAAEVVHCVGRRRSPVTAAGYNAGRSPRNKGRRYPADPPTVEEIVAVMRQAGHGAHGERLRAHRRALARGLADW